MREWHDVKPCSASPPLRTLVSSGGGKSAADTRVTLMSDADMADSFTQTQHTHHISILNEVAQLCAKFSLRKG